MSTIKVTLSPSAHKLETYPSRGQEKFIKWEGLAEKLRDDGKMKDSMTISHIEVRSDGLGYTPWPHLSPVKEPNPKSVNSNTSAAREPLQIVVQGDQSTKPAASPWRTGEPPREGRYLVQVQDRMLGEILYACVEYEPQIGWWGIGRDTVLRWAGINPPSEER